MKRVMAEGHEIGNHTWTHPDISEISPGQVELQLNLTERLFGSKLGVKPLFFRPPYSISIEEPDTNDQAAPAYLIQKMGYTIIGNKIDTGDWDERQRKTPQGILNDVLDQLQTDEDQAAVSRQHHPDARWRRRPQRDGRGAAGADRWAARAWLCLRAGLRPDGENASGSDAAAERTKNDGRRGWIQLPSLPGRSSTTLWSASFSWAMF